MVTNMATKSVGIRELKEGAPKLVQRAERGERILITRHGKAAAVLAPAVDEDLTARARPNLRVWQRERRSFERLSATLAQRYDGRFVAVLDGKPIDSDPDATLLFERVAAAFPGRVFFIGRVQGPDSFVDMPGFTVG